DLEDNQILLWTLRLLTRAGLNRVDVRASIRAAFRALSTGVSLVPAAGLMCVNRRYHRLNEDYQALHGICRFFLEHMGPGVNEGEHTMIPFVVDMPDLFERFIALWMKSNLIDRYGVRIQYVAPLKATQKLSFRIDIVLEEVGTHKPLAVVDTKYKIGETPLGSDVEQVVAYAVKMGVKR